MAGMNPRPDTTDRQIERMGKRIEQLEAYATKGAGISSLTLISEHASKRAPCLSCSSLRPKGLVFP